MKPTMKKLTAFLLSLLVLIPAAAFALTPLEAAELAYGDEIFTNVANTVDLNGCYSMQGMGVGEKYAYLISLATDNVRAIVSRVELATGETVSMRYKDTKRTYFTGFGHANGADVLTLDDQDYLMVSAGTKVVMLEIRDDSLYPYGEFDLTYNGSPFGASSLAVYKVTAKKFMLLFKWGNTISNGVFDRGATSGTVPVSAMCTLDVSQVPVNGKKVDFSSFVRQGFGYRNDVIFLPLSGTEDVKTLSMSAVICYDIRRASGTVQPIPDMVYFIKSSKYASLIEAEDCGVGGDGRLYFNANRQVNNNGKDNDGLMRINDLFFSGEGSGACRHFRCAEKAEEKYLASPANCHSGACYYRSCLACGEAVSDTFTVGGRDPHRHDGGTEVRGGVTVCLGCGAPLDGAAADAEADLSGLRRLLAAAGEIASALLRGDLALPMPDPGDLWRRAEP